MAHDCYGWCSWSMNQAAPCLLAWLLLNTVSATSSAVTAQLVKTPQPAAQRHKKVRRQMEVRGTHMKYLYI